MYECLSNLRYIENTKKTLNILVFKYIIGEFRLKLKIEHFGHVKEDRSYSEVSNIL